MPLSDNIIYDAFLAILRRPPLNDDEWRLARGCESEFDVLRSLRESNEFRHKNPDLHGYKAAATNPLVINCEQDITRRDYVRSQFTDRQGFAVEFVPAVDARSGSFERDFGGCFDPKTKIKGTAACFLSHRRCWQLIVDRHLSAAFICEDDITFDFESKSLQLLSDAPMDCDIIFLNERATTYRSLGMIPAREGFLTVGEVYRRARAVLGDGFEEQCHGGVLHPVGGDGYLLTQSGAKKLLLHDVMKANSFHVDFYLWFRALEIDDILSGNNVGFVRLLAKYHGLGLTKLRGYVAPYPIVKAQGSLSSVREPPTG